MKTTFPNHTNVTYSTYFSESAKNAKREHYILIINTAVYLRFQIALVYIMLYKYFQIVFDCRRACYDNGVIILIRKTSVI